MRTLFAGTESTNHSSPPDLPAQPDLLEKIIQAREEHVRDLRILLDKSAEREQELAGMVRMVMEERFYRPAITREGGKATAQAPILPLESLSDVSSFDSEADRKRMEEGERVAKEIESEFAEILNEHNRSAEDRRAE